MEEWKSYRLGDVIKVLDYKRVPLSSKERETRKGIFPYYGAQGIIDYIDDFIFDGEYLLIAEDGENLKSQKRNIARIARGRYWVNNHAHIVESNGKCDIRYICYMLNSMDLSGYITGSAQPKLNQANLLAIELSLPELVIQKRIADLLSTFDDKIALNNRINHNLEDCLFSLYIHLLDSQCGSSTIGQVSERVYSGGTPDTKINDYWGGAIHWLSSGETSERFIIDTEKKITENGFRHSSTKFASKYDVVIASAGQGNTRGQTSMTLLDTCINQSVIVIHADSYEAPIIFCSLANRYDELRAISDASSIRGSLTTKMISALEIPIFPEIEAIKFSSQAKYIIDQIENNLKENYNLKVQRDTLLPKLMSGELCE